MAKKPQDSIKRVSIKISTEERPQFDHPLAAYIFDEHGELSERVDVRDNKVELPLPDGMAGRMRIFVAPSSERVDARKPTAALMERMGAYEPVLQLSGKVVERIDVPGIIIDRWPFCFCWIRGRVVRQSDNRVVCDARVHICEVDRIIWWIAKLPNLDVLRLRDDLLEVIRNPPIPKPQPVPGPEPDPFRPRRPGPDPAPFARPLFRAAMKSGDRFFFNPQPDPPRASALAPTALQLPQDLHARLLSTSAVIVRSALIENWKLIVPWLCIWPWWWWRFRCDEVAVVTTDSHGRFETTIFYPCGGDHPDLYFWVEYDFGGGFETVYHPVMACNTYWNYVCGSDVTIRVSDPRVPGCDEEPNLPGCQVVVLSIGRDVAVREIQTSGVEGLTTVGQPFGGTLEPRVDFSRTCLIDDKGIPYYRWSMRRLSGPDGVTATVDSGSVPLNVWSPLAHDVYRHYKVGTSYPSDHMGPMPTVGPSPAPLPNLFRIRPVLPPAGNEWIVLDETVDLATAYFRTALLLGAPPSDVPAPVPDDLAAGRYELKLELFTAAGALVNWTTTGIDLRITDQNAPFGIGPITTSPAPDYNRILVGGHTMGFRMVLRVDNNRCYAEILPAGGTVTPDPVCGFHNYNSPSDVAAESFMARHPNHFAYYSFLTTRGPGPTVGDASTTGVAGEGGTNGFSEIADFNYSKNVIVSTLLGPCSNAAFSERLDVMATATNGYATLTNYNHADNAAFALALPCPTCECEENGHGHGGPGHGPA